MHWFLMAREPEKAQFPHLNL